MTIDVASTTLFTLIVYIATGYTIGKTRDIFATIAVMIVNLGYLVPQIKTSVPLSTVEAIILIMIFPVGIVAGFILAARSRDHWRYPQPKQDSTKNQGE